MARNTVEEVYTKIHGDLDEALNLLADYEPNDKNHYSLASVYGLKARALLTQQKYADAATAAVNSINEAEKDGCKIMSQSELMNGFANITSATKEAMYAAMTQNDHVLELQLQLYPHRYQMYQPKYLRLNVANRSSPSMVGSDRKGRSTRNFLQPACLSEPQVHSTLYS